jgi:DNA-binding ferritin-like protein
MHQLHLSVSGIGSFAAHKALNEYYDAITDLIDNVAEQYQGAKESLLEFPLVNPVRLNTVEDAVELLRGLHEKTTSLQRMIPFSEVVNQLDEVKSLIASTKYKLLFLK